MIMKNKKLHNIKKSGFKTPEGYFDAVEDTILNKIKEDVTDLSNNTGFNIPDNYFENFDNTILDKIKNKEKIKIDTTGFNTPDDYFNTVESSVFTKINDDKDIKVVTLFSRKNILYASSIAAAIVILFSIFNTSNTNTFDTIDTELLANYLEEQELLTDDIAYVLTEDDLSETDFGINNDTFDNESLEDYLIDTINLEDLIDQ